MTSSNFLINLLFLVTVLFYFFFDFFLKLKRETADIVISMKRILKKKIDYTKTGAGILNMIK